MKRAFFLILKTAAAFFFTILPARAQVATITGNLQTLGVQNVGANGTFVRFSLRNYGSNLPFVPGTTTNVWADQDFFPNSIGNISGSLYMNTMINPGGTFYHVCVWYRNQLFRCLDSLINTTPWNLNNPVGIIPGGGTGIGPGQSIIQCSSFVQSTPATTWTIAHGFGDTNVLVQVFDSGNNLIVPNQVTITDGNTVTLTFVANQSGRASVCHGVQVNIATNQPNAVITNPVAPQTILGQPLNVQGPFNASAGGSFAGAYSGSPSFTGTPAFNGGLTSTSVTDSALTVGNCVQGGTGGTLVSSSGPCGTSSGTLTATGSPVSGNLAKFSGATSLTNGDLSGDCSTSGTLVDTCAKINGNSFPSGVAAHQLAVGTAASAFSFKTVPDCQDSAGNHLNYTQSSDSFSCGNTSGSLVIRYGSNSSVCSTAGSSYSGCSTVVTWNASFADNSYYVTCSGIGASGFPYIEGLSKSTTSVTVSIRNGTSNGAQVSSYTEIDCTGIHP